jgi:hypothetical protein
MNDKRHNSHHHEPPNRPPHSAGLNQDGAPHDGALQDGDGRHSDRRDEAARQIGFRNYDALVAGSTPITGRNGQVHMIVEGTDGRWIVWLEETWPEYRTFDSIHHAGRAAGEDA